jgi:hypothetical protein
MSLFVLQWLGVLKNDRLFTMYTCKIVNVFDMYSRPRLLSTERPALSSDRTPLNDKAVTVLTESGHDPQMGLDTKTD